MSTKFPYTAGPFVSWPPGIWISLLSGRDSAVHNVYVSFISTKNLAHNKTMWLKFSFISFYINFIIKANNLLGNSINKGANL